MRRRRSGGGKPRPGFEATRTARMNEARELIEKVGSYSELLKIDERREHPASGAALVVMHCAADSVCAAVWDVRAWPDVQSEALEAIDAPALSWSWNLPS